MTPELLAILVSAVLMIIGILMAFAGWQRLRSVRAVLRWLSLSFIALGLWITGVMDLIFDAAHALLNWARDQRLDTVMWIGIGVAGFGVLLYIISAIMSPVSRTEGRQRRDLARQKQASQLGGAPGRQAPAQPTLTTSTRTDHQPVSDDTAILGSTDEDAEVDEILKRRGIN